VSGEGHHSEEGVSRKLCPEGLLCSIVKVVYRCGWQVQQGAPKLSAPVGSSLRFFFPAHVVSSAYRLFLPRNQLCQPALLTGRGILMDDAFLGGAVEQLHRFGVGGGGLGTGGGTDFPERRPELASMGTVVNGAGTTLAHTLGGGLDTGHGNLGHGEVRSGIDPEAEPEKIGHRGRKVKRDAVLTLSLLHV
jgi:hypothetical protein